jgi:RNA polymerase sigma factor (sigma-70 family)
MSTDAELLRRFAADGSQAAFTLLVERHIGLVYRAALRQLAGDRHSAEDVTQTVFALLARKAGKIPNHVVLAAWLFNATRYSVSHFIRAHRRRLRRESEAQTMKEILSDPVSDAIWPRVRPELDELVAALNQKEREAILLRFFEGYSFADVGAQLGVTQDAARMRVDRALEKLRDLLSARGVKSTSAVLGTMLAFQIKILVGRLVSLNSYSAASRNESRPQRCQFPARGLAGTPGARRCASTSDPQSPGRAVRGYGR